MPESLGQGVFTQPGSSAEMTALAFDVGFTLNIRHSFDSSARQFRADFVAEVR